MSTRKPRLALMGEFSAGKSTLSNLLLGAAPLPTRVTATRLPPVWLSYGTAPASRVDLNGNTNELPGGTLDCVNPERTRLVRLHIESELLELCDLIDLPGISDPNLPRDLWSGVMSEVDQVVWCTHATQAWRQSEAAAWEAMMSQTNGRNLLLVTQVDKLASERDRARVMARVMAETEGLFVGHYPISLTQALAAGDDADAWERSGAAAFTEHLVDLLVAPVDEAAANPGSGKPVASQCLEPTDVTELSANDAADVVLPKRVRNQPGDRLRTRPIQIGQDTPVLQTLQASTGDRP